MVCPDAAAEFSRCAHLVVNHTGKQADVPDCSKQLREDARVPSTKAGLT